MESLYTAAEETQLSPRTARSEWIQLVCFGFKRRQFLARGTHAGPNWMPMCHLLLIEGRPVISEPDRSGLYVCVYNVIFLLLLVYFREKLMIVRAYLRGCRLEGRSAHLLDDSRTSRTSRNSVFFRDGTRVRSCLFFVCLL